MDSEKKLKFAVLGVGRMGTRHAQNVAFHTPRAQLVAIVDPNPEALNAAKEWAPKGVKFYTQVQEALEDKEVEAVLVASVTASHAPDAIAAIEAGKVSDSTMMYGLLLFFLVCALFEVKDERG